MRCPFCSSEDTQVKDSRISDDKESIKRRRYCSACDSRFTTFERVQLREILVIKKNGEKRIFDPEKLKRSIETSVRKRPVNEMQVDKLVNKIMRDLESHTDTEISSAKIGEMAMTSLEKLDKVAFVRFASVYKNFENMDDFQEFVEKIAQS
jgi:transcriptional repressor NrdR|tara:strand:+ start:6551 stop:7003 length:453 start_codon:yes stop_codon:yes gene_type:complete